MRLKHLLPLLFAVFSIFVSYGQLSTRHYIPPVAGSSATLIQEQYIYISTPKTDNVGYTIRYLGTNFSESGVVSNANPVELTIKNPNTGNADFDANSYRNGIP